MKLISILKDTNIVVDKNLYTFFNPDYIYLPILDNALLVKQDDLIGKNDRIFKNSDLVPSISGRIMGIANVYFEQSLQRAVVVENDFKEYAAKIKRVKKHITIEDILKNLEKFDSRLLDKFKNIVSCENIVISAVCDEPYVFNEIMTLKDNIDALLEMIDTLCTLYKCKKASIVLKASESDIVFECLQKIGTYPNVSLSLVEDLYLLGKKEFLLSKIACKDTNTLYLTVQQLYEFIRIVKHEMIPSTKYVTFSGDALLMGKVIVVKKFTKLKEVMQKYLEFNTDDYVILINNLLHSCVVLEDLIITDEIFSVHFMKKKEFRQMACIRCGKCIKVCPFKIDAYYSYKKKIKDKRCIDCGLCSYVCPSFINLGDNRKGEEK